MAVGLLGLEDLTSSEIEAILARAAHFRETSDSSQRRSKKRPVLASLFFESSARTRAGFESACERLGMEMVSLPSDSLANTVRNLAAMRPDAVVMRHSAAGAPALVASRVAIPVINAGDAAHEHPIAALATARTILNHGGTLRNLRVSVIGDLAHSRVGRSLIHLLSKFGAHIALCGPAPLVPVELARIAPGVTLYSDLSEAVRQAEAIITLPEPAERQREFFPAGEYAEFYTLRAEHMALAKPAAMLIAHHQREDTVEVCTAVLERIIGEQAFN